MKTYTDGGTDRQDVKREARKVVRHFQHYTSEQRATLAASHRLGPCQRQAVGEVFYTHPAIPGRAFGTRRRAAETAVSLSRR